jgi:hypothetical protein
MRLRLLLPATLALAASTLIAHADTIYNYTGKDFTVIHGSYTTKDSVTGSFTTTSPLADNLDGAPITPASFSFNDGVDTITNTNDNEEHIFIWTNASGSIVDWEIILESHNSNDEIISMGGPQFQGQGGDLGASGASLGQSNVWGVFSSPRPTGVTPEPSTLALFGTGILGLAGMARRKFLPHP